MRVICTRGPGRTQGAERLAGLESKGLAACHREGAVARCPRCGGGIGPSIRRAAPGFFCRCPVRRMRAAAA